MCNLSIGVYRRGYNKGAEEKKKEMVSRMLEKKADLDFITSVSDYTKEYVKKVAEEMHMTIT